MVLFRVYVMVLFRVFVVLLLIRFNDAFNLCAYLLF